VNLTRIAVVSAAVAIMAMGGPTPYNNSSDGRYAKCGVVTTQGVTEHLDAYAQRCGKDK
jgi:hypothetical protein